MASSCLESMLLASLCAGRHTPPPPLPNLCSRGSGPPCPEHQLIPTPWFCFVLRCALLTPKSILSVSVGTCLSRASMTPPGKDGVLLTTVVPVRAPGLPVLAQRTLRE